MAVLLENIRIGLHFQAVPSDQCYKTFYCRKLRPEPTIYKMDLSGAPLKARLLASLTNIRLGWKGLLGTNALAYYEKS
jgi:hypothetical protein